MTVGRGAYEWVQALVCSVLTVVLIFTFAVRIVRVSGESMRETLQDQDMLVVLNNWLCGGYEQGDIVILQRDDFYGGEPIVKRVIATEGQTVDIDFDAGVVYVDGTALEEPYTREPTWTQEGTEFPLTVPTAGIPRWGRWIPAVCWARCCCWRCRAPRRTRSSGTGAAWEF